MTKDKEDLITCPFCGGSGKEPLFSGMLCGHCDSSGKVDANKKMCKLCGHSKNEHDGSYCYHAKPDKKGHRVETLHKYECSAESASGQFICGCNPEDVKGWYTAEQKEAFKKQLAEQGVESFFQTISEIYERAMNRQNENKERERK